MIRLKRALLPLAIVALAWTCVALLTGGLDVRIAGVALRARGTWRPLFLGFALLTADAAVHRSRWTRWTAQGEVWLSSVSTPIAILAMMALLFHAVWFSPRVAGGSDSYGYVSEAYGWLTRQLPRPSALLNLPFPASDWLQIPLGYRPGPDPHTMVPTYSPGLPLMMAAVALVFGRYGVFLVVPLSAAVFIWAVWDWGRRTGGAIAGGVAAAVGATSPIVLYQAIAPMSDVPAGALWTGAGGLALHDSVRSAFASGAFVAGGLLVRPNLLPLVALPFVVTVVRRRTRALIAAAAFLAPVLIVIGFVAWLNEKWYGGPLQSGYGAAADIYAWQNVTTNLFRYVDWFWQSQSPWSAVVVLPLLPFLARDSDRLAAWTAVAMMLGTLACYLPYAPFDVWWYLRFLLPGMGAVAVLIGVGIVVILRAVPRPWGGLAALTIALGLIRATLAFAAANSTFGMLRDSERRYAHIGEFVARALPDDAVVFAVQHSGSIRLYGGRYTLRYDAVEPEAASHIAQTIAASGLHPFLVADDGELPDVRQHFRIPANAPLPWPILARMRDLGGVNLYDMTADPRTVTPTALEPVGLEWCPPILPLKPPVARPH